MANKSKNAERRAVAERLRKEQQRKERLRSFGILGVCVVVVLGLLSFAVVKYVGDRRQASQPGAAQSSAGCSKQKIVKASGNQDHIAPPTVIKYPAAPPAFGKHWPNFLTGSEIRTFYTRDDVPQIERLVHSLEHGYTILWYDDAVTDGSADYKTMQRITSGYDVSDKLIAAPYITKDDGGRFPKGKNFALTHWTGPTNQKGVTQYCSGVNSGMVSEFMKQYDKDDAPEPGGI